jgi:GntR family transcriptional regulator
MEFRENEAIYLQIAAHVGDHILLGKWGLNEKIPSVRDLAVDLQVNPNTVMRSYEFLQSQEVILNKRGIGFFVTADAKKKIMQDRKASFLGQELPEFFRKLDLMGISMKDITARFESFKSAKQSEK